MDDIFIKSTKNGIEPLDFNKIVNNIPEPNFKESQNELKKDNTEWRWRVLEFNGKRKIEISYLKAGMRMYMNSSGEWVKRNISDEYDNYVVDQWFFYNRSE